MQGGDISNESAPRVIIVLDDLLLRVPRKKKRIEKMWVRMGQWQRAAKLHELDELVRTYMWDLIWRSNLSVDLATFQPEPYAEALRDRLDEYGLSFGHLMITTPAELAQRMAYLPHVLYVYYAVPERNFMFGDRGVWVRKAQDIKA